MMIIINALICWAQKKTIQLVAKKKELTPQSLWPAGLGWTDSTWTVCHPLPSWSPPQKVLVCDLSEPIRICMFFPSQVDQMGSKREFLSFHWSTTTVCTLIRGSGWHFICILINKNRKGHHHHLWASSVSVCIGISGEAWGGISVLVLVSMASTQMLGSLGVPTWVLVWYFRWPPASEATLWSGQQALYCVPECLQPVAGGNMFNNFLHWQKLELNVSPSLEKISS